MRWWVAGVAVAVWIVGHFAVGRRDGDRTGLIWFGVMRVTLWSAVVAISFMPLRWDAAIVLPIVIPLLLFDAAGLVLAIRGDARAPGTDP